MKQNLILLTDSYKTSHYLQYPPHTTKVFSYLESRGGVFDNTVFFGLQYILQEHLEHNQVTEVDVLRAARVCEQHGVPFNAKGWMHIVTKHNGYLPLRIRAVPEGTVVPTGNVLMTVENTDPECFWLTNYLETLLLQVWYPTTVATLSREMKKIIGAGLAKSGDINLLPFKLHDFGFRGTSSLESASIGGAAHLVNFMGTDTIPALELLMEHYNCDTVPGYSIPATEHSTITAWGKVDEIEAYRNLLLRYPEGTVACVSDSYDIYNACENLWGGELKEAVLNRNGTLVIRPDSGSPPVVVLRVLEILSRKFGYTTNDKGYKVLPPQVRVIQGDGITFEMTKRIIDVMFESKFSIDNIAFGMGGGLLQKVDRDTQKFAFKCSAIEVNGNIHQVYKQPVDEPFKASKKGLLKLMDNPYSSGDHINTKQCYTESVDSFDELDKDNLLVPVFENGKVLRRYKLETVRENAKVVF